MKVSVSTTKRALRIFGFLSVCAFLVLQYRLIYTASGGGGGGGGGGWHFSYADDDATSSAPPHRSKNGAIIVANADTEGNHHYHGSSSTSSELELRRKALLKHTKQKLGIRARGLGGGGRGRLLPNGVAAPKLVPLVEIPMFPINATGMRLTNADTLILVMSVRDNFERRQAIRETWASGHDNVYFVVADEACPHPHYQRTSELDCDLLQGDAAIPRNATMDEEYNQLLAKDAEWLRDEQDEFHDIIFTRHQETYRNLPRKLKDAYAFATEHTQAKWIIKADDDFFVRVETVSEYLSHYDHTIPSVIGRIMKDDLVRKTGKWAERNYRKVAYPKFPLGSTGHAVSRPIVEFIAANRQTLFEYQGEDTSLGIWLDQSGLDIKWTRSKVFNNAGMCRGASFFVMGHGISPEKIRKCYNVSDETITTQREKPDWIKNSEQPIRSRRRRSVEGESLWERLGFVSKKDDEDEEEEGEIRREVREKLERRSFDPRTSLRDKLERRQAWLKNHKRDKNSNKRDWVDKINDLNGDRHEVEDVPIGQERSREDRNRRMQSLKAKRKENSTFEVEPVATANPPEHWVAPRITQETTVVVVLNENRNARRRNLIRQTWATGHDNVYFVISAPCPYRKMELVWPYRSCVRDKRFLDEPIHPDVISDNNKIQRSLAKEQEEHRDLIYVSGLDSYLSLAHKLKEGLGWVMANTNAKWVIKADDDMYVRLPTLVKYLERYPAANPTVLGRIIPNSPVQRAGKSANQEYKPDIYPPWPMGSCGYAVSRPILRYIAANKDFLHAYPGEDTSLGIWLDESPMRDEVVFIRSRAFINEGNCTNSEALIVGHQLSPPKILECHDILGKIEDLPDHDIEPVENFLIDYDNGKKEGRR